MCDSALRLMANPLTKIGLQLLRKAANYSGGAATGAIVAAAAGAPVSVQVMGTLVGLVATCLVTESVTESVQPDDRIARIETWLEELVRRHGQLDRALKAIAEGRERNRLVSEARAATVYGLQHSTDSEESDQWQSDPDAAAVLQGLSIRLEGLDKQVLDALQAQADQLRHIADTGQQNARSLTSLHEKMDSLMAGRSAPPSEEDIARRAIDETDNCRLRAEALQRLREEMDFEGAALFADRCEAWLDLATQPTLAARSELLERLVDEALTRFRRSADDEKAERSVQSERLRRLVTSVERTLPHLDEAARLKATSQLAYAEALLVSADAGLARLDGRSDPYAIRRRLAILFDAKRQQEGMSLVRGVRPAAEWVKKAVIIAAGCGEWAEVRRLLTWAHELAPRSVERTCRLLVIEAVVFARDPEARPASLSGAERELYEWLHELLEPFVIELKPLAEPRHPADAYVLQLALQLAFILDKTGELQPLSDLLARRRPLDLGLGLLAVRGRIRAEADWPQRLRTEGAWSFDRQLVAASLEAEDDDRRLAAFRSAIRLAERATSPDQRQRLHGLLMQTAQRLGDEERREFERVAPSLVDGNDRMARLWSAGRQLAARNDASAETALEELRDGTDPLWLQLHGQLLLRKQQIVEGVRELAEAARLLDDVGLLSDVSGLALSHRQWDVAVKLLERLLVVRPADTRAKSGLAMALYQRQDFERASVLLLELADSEPADTARAVNAAGCLIHAGLPDRAVDVLRKVCAEAEPPLEAVVTLAQLLVERDDAPSALALMNRHRQRFWERFEFVGVYWGIAYAAEDEAAGHEGFLQMRQLQATGAAPAGAVVEKTLEDILQMGRDYNQRQREMAAAVLQGRLPWIVVAHWQHEPVFRAWAHRTTERRWVLERPEVIVEASVYASNAFTVSTIRGGRHLVPVEGPPRQQPFVADLSALVTLQQLGLLEAAVAYAGRVHVPQSYLFKMFVDHDRLRPHQPSRRTVLTAVRQAIASGTVSVEEPVEGAKRVDEHYPKEQGTPGAYHLRDLAETLKGAGVVADKALARLLAVSHRPATAPWSHEPLALGDPLSISLSTLSTLHFCGLLDTAFAQFQVSVSGEDRAAVFGETAWFEGQEKLREDHRALWDFLLKDPRTERAPEIKGGGPPTSEEEGEGASRPESIAVDALALAEELGLPLLVDDRALQVQLLNRRPHTASASFGTAELLSAMAEAQHITRDEQARGVRKLMDWRYRFIVPDDELLLHWARGSMASPPGPDLRAVARYLHDCLRDPGLFAGFEPTDPPTSIASKLHQAIEVAVGDFLGELWRDGAVPEQVAELLTKWCAANLLPSPPVTMEPGVRILSELRYPLLISTFLVRLARAADTERARRGAECLRRALGFKAQEFVHRAVETIDGIGSGID